MTSIFDQYEQASQVTQRPKPVADAMTSSGYINMQEDTTPMFSKQKMNLNPSDTITHVAVASDYLVLAMANSKLFRMDLKKPDNCDEVTYAKVLQPNTKLSEIFLDPLGYHLLLSFSAKTKEGSPELVYLNRKTTKLRPISKSRKSEITEVGWNFQNMSEGNTGSILLGTSQGHIIESEFEADSEKNFLTDSQKCWRQCFDIGKGEDTPITGIQYHSINNTSKHFVFVTTPKRLYQFIGYANYLDNKTILQSIFHSYLNVPETAFQDIQSSLNYSKLQFSFDKFDMPKTFAWLTEPGIFYGELDPNSQPDPNSLFTQGQLLNYPVNNSNTSKTTPPPLSFVLTDFHALILYPDKIKAISLISQELVHEDTYSESQGKLRSIVKDLKRRTIWAVTDKAVFRYKVVREERNLWKIYCDKEQFDLAKEYCSNNPAYVDIINVKQAELLFRNGKYEASAKIFGDTQSSFETICLKFLEIDEIDALKVYLHRRLDDLADDDKTLITMIVLWMMELYASQLSSLRRSGLFESTKYARLQSDFDVFLVQPKVMKCMQHTKNIIYELLSSHGDEENLNKVTMLNENHENVISQMVYRKNYAEALKILQMLKKPDLYYQFASNLIEGCPKETVNALIALGQKLTPSKLLPAFLSCENDESHALEIIRYLEFILMNFDVHDRALHNYLFTLYAEYQPESLMKYITRQGNDLVNLKFDVHYALRLCRKKELNEACVQLSALLGLWEDAVELALDVDISLAKQIANMPQDEEVQRAMWLKIAQQVISHKQDVKEAMLFLQECPLIKIEDILTFFSDVVTIDHFREPICQSLQEYNNQIEELKIEMEEATRSAEQVRNEINSFRGRAALVPVSAACSVCSLALLLRPFYIFPCGHKLHADCLYTEVQSIIGPARRNQLADIHRQLNQLSNAELSTVTSCGITLREQFRNEYDAIVARECVFCGDHVIQCIDKPFIDDEDWDRVVREWE